MLKTHYGLPQAGALSQERLFDHLERNRYFPLFHTPSIFRNHNGTVRFSLVVDDFAVVWSHKTDMNHFIKTLRQLYTVKVDWNGGKNLGMTIDINQSKRAACHTLYAWLHHQAHSSAVSDRKESRARQHRRYISPQITNHLRLNQTATIDETPLASLAQQRELQVVVGTLLYYARSVDPSILTAVHELGSVQSKPTVQDIRKMERLLQYVSSHQNYGIRFHASSMQLQIQSDASYLCRTKARSDVLSWEVFTSSAPPNRSTVQSSAPTKSYRVSSHQLLKPNRGQRSKMRRKGPSSATAHAQPRDLVTPSKPHLSWWTTLWLRDWQQTPSTLNDQKAWMPVFSGCATESKNCNFSSDISKENGI